MKEPLILIYGSELSLFKKKEDVERHIESPDLEDYVLFDAAGARLSFFVNSRSPRGSVPGWVMRVDPVTVVGGESTDETAALLASHLEKYLLRNNRSIKSRSIEYLINEAALIAGFEG